MRSRPSRTAWILLATLSAAIPCGGVGPTVLVNPVNDETKSILEDAGPGRDIDSNLARLRSLKPCLQTGCSEPDRQRIKQTLETLRQQLSDQKEPADPKLKAARPHLLSLIDMTSKLVAESPAAGQVAAMHLDVVMALGGALSQAGKADDAVSKAKTLSSGLINKLADSARRLMEGKQDKPSSTPDRRPDSSGRTRSDALPKSSESSDPKVDRGVFDSQEYKDWLAQQPWNSENQGTEMPGSTPVLDGDKTDHIKNKLDIITDGTKSWKSGSPDAEGMSGGKAGGGPSGDGGVPGGPGNPSQMNLANPKTDKEILLAAGGPFKSAARAVGLKVGAGPDGAPRLVNIDGSSASANSLAALLSRIQEDPRSLVRRPDFFGVVDRDSFMHLKDRFRQADESRDTFFRHMAFQDGSERDFQWNRSCDAASDNCNGFVESSSYRRGNYVSPEDLARIVELMGGISRENAGHEDISPPALGSRITGSVAARIMGALSALGRTLGLDRSSRSWFFPGPGAGEDARQDRLPSMRSPERRERGPVQKPRAAEPPGYVRSRSPAVVLIAVALASAGLLLALLLKRRKRSSQGFGGSPSLDDDTRPAP